VWRCHEVERIASADHQVVTLQALAVEDSHARQRQAVGVRPQVAALVQRAAAVLAYQPQSGQLQMLHQPVEGTGRQLLVVLAPSRLGPGLRVGIAAAHAHLPGAGQV